MAFKGIILGAIIDVGGINIWEIIAAIYSLSHAEQTSHLLEKRRKLGVKK